MKKQLKILLGSSIGTYLVAAVFIAMGFQKLYVYENNSDHIYKDSINAYVGGDAYNYIINTGYATSFFVVALMFVVIGSVLLLMFKLEGGSFIKN